MKRYSPIMVLVILAMLFTACAPATPQVITVEKEVVVEKPVIQTVIVEKEVPVEKEVVKTVVVEKEVSVEKTVIVEVEKEVVRTVVVEKEKIVEATPKPGGKMVWSRAEPCEGTCTNFHLAGGDYVGWHAQNPAFLTTCDESGAKCNLPGLATRWKESDDHMTWTYYLRDDVRWSDGTYSTADDHVFTINVITHPDFGGTAWLGVFKDVEGFEDYQDGSADSLAGIKKIDDHTFSITFSVEKRREPYDVSAYKLHPYHLMKDKTMAEWKDQPIEDRISVGPYYFTDIVYDQYYAMKANPYFYLGPPHIEDWVYRAIPNWAVAIAGLQSGEVDVVDVTPLDEIPGLTQVEHLNILPDAMARGYLYWFNTREGKTLPLKVRQAMNLAIDRQTIIDTLWEGYGWTIPCQFQPQGVPLRGIIPDANEYDPERAKELVQEALDEGWNGKGWSGENTLILYYYYTTEFTKQLMAAVADMWTGIGLEVDYQLLPTDKVIEAFYDKGEYDVLYGCCADRGNLEHFKIVPLYHCDSRYPDAWSGQGVCDEQMDEWTTIADSTFDRQAEIEAYQNACSWLIDNVVTVPLWMSPGLWTINGRLSNTITPDGFFNEYVHTWWVE